MTKGIPKGFKPMLAGKAPDDLSKLTFPLLASPKLDGIRCVTFGGIAYSRNLKPIPNKFVQRMLKGLPDGFDGELICGEMVGAAVWNNTQSGIMSEDGSPAFTFHVFDWVSTDDSTFETFRDRYKWLREWMVKRGTNFYRYVPQQKIEDLEHLTLYEDAKVRAGFEGVMIRDPMGVYKYGRSTTKEGGLLKVKRFNDAEALVVDAVEQMHNGNAAKLDELGRTKRSSHKANKTGKGVLGALVCTITTPADDPKHPGHHRTRPVTRFELGTGFDDATRADLWKTHQLGRLCGKVVKFKYQDLTPEGKPRFPVFLGFRDERDM